MSNWCYKLVWGPNWWILECYKGKNKGCYKGMLQRILDGYYEQSIINHCGPNAEKSYIHTCIRILLAHPHRASQSPCHNNNFKKTQLYRKLKTWKIMNKPGDIGSSRLCSNISWSVGGNNPLDCQFDVRGDLYSGQSLRLYIHDLGSGLSINLGRPLIPYSGRYLQFHYTASPKPFKSFHPYIELWWCDSLI